MVNTFDDYIVAVRSKYEVEKNKIYSDFLLKPSPAQMRELCLLIHDKGLSNKDKEVFELFFRTKPDSTLRKAIENSDLEIPLRKGVIHINKSLQKSINKIRQQEFVFFTKGDNVANLNHVMTYIRNNEHTKKIKIVIVLREGEELVENLETDIKVLDRMYPEIDIEFVKMIDKFGPNLIQKLSAEWNIPANFMFVGSPGDKFPYRIEELGGVRLII